MRKTATYRNKKNKIRLRSSDLFMQIFVITLVVILLIVVMYPLIYVLSCSISDSQAVNSGKVILWPIGFSLNGYKLVFSYKKIWVGYANTIFYTVVGTLLNLVLTTCAAYPLSRKFFGHKLVMTLFLIIMFFSGGMIPNYILMSNLHLTNTRWAVLLSGALSVYNMIIMRTFFQNSIPRDLLEAAKIDGITDIGYLLRIVIPLSKAIFAVITLYYAVAHWNSYFSAMLYLRKPELYPLQMVLRSILNAGKIDPGEMDDPEMLRMLLESQDLMKYALMIVSSLPLLVAYPFVQKFFKKGVMIGSVKG